MSAVKFAAYTDTMFRKLLALLFPCLITLEMSHAAGPPPSVHAFLKSHCVDCHDDDVKKGGFDLTALKFDLRDPAAFTRWVQVLDRVAAGEMPPKTEGRPDLAAVRAFATELADELRATDVGRIAREGRVPARRLTRFEFERSVHDLLGIDVPLMNLLPEDARADGFDTVSAAQQVSHHLLDKYLTAVDVALDAAFARATQPEPRYVIALGWPELKQFSTRQREPGPRPEHQDAVAWPTATAFHGRMPSTRVPASGWYRVTLRVAAVNPPADGQVWCSVRSGTCRASAPTLSWVGCFAAIAEEREHSFEAWIEGGHQLEVRPNDAGLPRAKFGTNIPTAEAERKGFAGVAIKSVRLERIHRGPEAILQRRLVFGTAKIEAGNSPAATDAAPRRRRRSEPPAAAPDSPSLASESPAADLAQIVRPLAARAFRAPVTEADLAPYLKVGEAELAKGGNLIDAVRGALRAVLSSPRFLYFEEPAGRLPDHAIAARLSYFLWSTIPDDPLRAAADAGSLHDPREIREQVERMLGDPRARTFVENFTDQWLNLAEIDFTVPDAKLYPEFDEVLKHAMLDETRSFFREMVQRDLSVTHVVDSPFGLMNNRLARHYGVRWPGGEGTQRVSFRPEDHRGGLITQASVLKVTANGTSTSPVIRGVWMLERIMGIGVPPVPADVPALEPDVRGARTIREQLDRHRNTAACAVCHVKIDPPGFALESYDVIGGWRDRYRTAKEAGKNWEPGAAVDPSYALADGRRFADVAEFKQLLLADRDQLARNLASKLVTYATGAGISFSDRAAIEAIVARTRTGGHGVRSMLHAVVASPLFLNK